METDAYEEEKRRKSNDEKGECAYERITKGRKCQRERKDKYRYVVRKTNINKQIE